MTQLNAILMAIDLATRRRDDAAKVVAQMQRNVEFANDQLAQLESYAADTDSRWIGAPPGMLSGELIRHHYQFVERLQQAIGMQTGVIVDAKTQVERASSVLLQTEYRLAGLKTVLEARQAKVARVLQRREQDVTDEFAALAYARAKNQFTQGDVAWP
jgi:flagellar FliJ protein